MRKVKLGLQKEVSKIFTGIMVPGKKSPDQPGVEQAKTGAADSQISSRPAVQTHQAPPASHTPLVEQPPTVSLPPKAVTPSQVVVTPSQQVVTPPPAIVNQSQQVVTPPPATVPPQSGDPYNKSIISAKPVPQTSRLFTIPEPPQSKTPEVKSPVYEPPARKQGVYEPPRPSVPPAGASARQQKVEIISTAPGRQSFVLKILRPLTDKFLAPRPGVSPLRQKATLVIVAILPLVLIFVLIKVFAAPAKGGAKSAKTTVAAADKSQINWQLPPPLPDNFRDPMIFGSPPPDQPDQQGPVVKGIVYSEDNPCAVVGERIVSPGDTVNGATVVKINPDSVEFADGDKKWTQKVER